MKLVQLKLKRADIKMVFEVFSSRFTLFALFYIMMGDKNVQKMVQLLTRKRRMFSTLLQGFIAEMFKPFRPAISYECGKLLLLMNA